MLDFGLAKLAAGEVAPDDATRTELDMTTPGTLLGTVSYMSPEQSLGKELDHRTDIFSLGVVLYEMITARRAFEGNTSAAVFDAILNRAPTAPVALNPQVPEDLERIVNKALEKDPALRYQSAADLCADLKRLRRDHAAPFRRLWSHSTISVLRNRQLARSWPPPTSIAGSTPSRASWRTRVRVRPTSPATSTPVSISSIFCISTPSLFLLDL